MRKHLSRAKSHWVDCQARAGAAEFQQCRGAPSRVREPLSSPTSREFRKSSGPEPFPFRLNRNGALAFCFDAFCWIANRGLPGSSPGAGFRRKTVQQRLIRVPRFKLTLLNASCPQWGRNLSSSALTGCYLLQGFGLQDFGLCLLRDPLEPDFPPPRKDASRAKQPVFAVA
jgi:hypothetical protein